LESAIRASPTKEGLLAGAAVTIATTSNSNNASSGASTSSQKTKAGATAAVMQDTLVALNERGEKLSQLADKSEELSQVNI
jgi:hypothetical protein